jgi:nitrite reductase/ring-hydroxylating ferredoxin subunit
MASPTAVPEMNSQSEKAAAPAPANPPLAGQEWFFAGLASSFPNITDSSEKWFKMVWPQACNDGTKIPACRVFHPQAGAQVREVPIDSAVGQDSWLLKEQVMVFQYKGKFHAVDHACPHRAYSLTWGAPFDIEDTGRTLGYGLQCRGHSYKFELSTGIGDTGDYRLGVWDVQLRESSQEGGGREVWVRRGRKAMRSR